MHRLNLFGGISIETGGGPLAGRAVQRRRLALLALLAGARPGGLSRDKLIAYLWPEADAESGRRFLSDSVYRINKALDGDAIVAVGDELRLDCERLSSDLTEFDDAFAKGDYAHAVALYDGPFLDGFFLKDAPEFERWADVEREQRARDYARALEALADTADQSGDRMVAVDWWKRLAALDPLNSRVTLRLMRALDAAGERAAAIQHARVHRALLHDEMGIDPDPAIAELAERMRTEPTWPPTAGAPPARPSTSPAYAPSLEAAAFREPTPPSSPATSAEPVPPTALAASPEAAGPLGREAPPPPSQVLESPAAPAARNRRAWIWSASSVPAVALILLVAAARTGRYSLSDTSTAERSIAVLPFANLSADRNDDYFSDGITEELISTLAAVEGLEVASRTSSFAFKNRPADVREIGQKLGVATIVEGSVRRSGTTLRITARLVDASTGRRMWSDEYERQMQDVLAIQEELSRAIVSKLTGSLFGARRVRLAEHPAQDPEAYDLYLKGRFAWHQRTREGLQKSVEYFAQAVARAPKYARAYAGLADAYAVSAFYDYRAPVDAAPKAQEAASNALRLDPSMAAPHATLAYGLTYYHLDWKAAEEEFQRAIALDPGYSMAHQWYGNLLTVAGRFDEAEREMRTAQETDPLSLIAQAALAWSFYYGGKYEAALEQSRKTLTVDSTFQLAHMWGGWALEALGRTDESRAWMMEAVRLSKGSELTRLALAHVLARSSSGQARDSALAIAGEMERRRARGEYVPSYEVGKLYLALGDRAKALEWLTRSFDERSHSRAFVHVDPQLAPLRGDARFERLAATVPR